jgi:hypothetical protein
MKKLLSICFLSIFLMMFGMQAQAQTDCCFKLFNPGGDTIHGLVNVPGGDLPQNHTMNPLVWQNTDSYSLLFNDSTCLSITGNSKVSIELELWLDGENVLDGQHNLSDYCSITMQSTYNELHWVGSPMIGSNYPYAFEYPGAIQIFEGTYNISNVNFDYFYYNFLMHGQTKVMITWNQIFRNAVLIAHVRERINGTDHELYWDDQQRLNVGGHQSQPMRILASDTISTDRYFEGTDTIKDCEPVTVGMPPYTMDTSGVYKVAYLDASGCNLKVDSIITYYYTHYIHPTTPTLHDSTYRYCQKGTADPIVLPAEPNPALADHVADIVPYWYFAEEDSFRYAASFVPVTDTTAGTYEYYVKRHDNLTGCESEIDTFFVTINANPSDPVVTNRIIEYCANALATPLTYPAPTGMQAIWGTDPDVDSLSATPITPSTLTAGETIYYVRLQDTTTVNQCVSEGYDSVIVKVFANPAVTITHDKDSLCYNDVVTLTADPNNLTTYAWSKDGILLPNDTLYTLVDTNKTTVEAFTKYRVDVTEKHDSVTCIAHAIDSIKVYPLIGTPTPVAPITADTALCGPGHSLTMEVANGANATTSTWYASDKTTVLGTGTTYTQTFNETDTIYVSSSNAKGCETPEDMWLRRIITVDTLPVVTLSADNNAEVCAGMDLIIRSNPVEPSYIYMWRGDSLVAPLNEDSVTFNSTLAGTFHDTLRVTNGNGCFNDFDITVTVDTLPVLTVGVDYTVKHNEFCVSANGKITFITEYVKYSIDNGTSWRNHPNQVFDTLAPGIYNLLVEDGNGCVNKPANTETINDNSVIPVPHLSSTANTHCNAPYDGTITIDSVTPATGAYHYRLYTPIPYTSAWQTSTVFDTLNHGFYTIFAEDTVTGCVGSDTISIKYNGVLPGGTVNGPDFICFGDTNTVFSFGTTEPNVIFNMWTYAGSVPQSTIDQFRFNPSFKLIGFPAGAHLFGAVIEDTMTHCTNTIFDTIRVISVNVTLIAEPNTTVCEYDTIKVYSQYFPDDPTKDTIDVYEWFNPNIIHITGVNDTVYVLPTADWNVISLTATDNHGCYQSTSKVLDVWKLPELIFGGDTAYCENTTTNLNVTINSTNNPSYIEWWKGTTNLKNETSGYSALNTAVGTSNFSLDVKVTDNKGCKNQGTVQVKVVPNPGAPIFDPETQYFCTANDIFVDTTHQAAPQTGTLTWATTSPNVAKVAGTYIAHYELAVQSSTCRSANDTVIVAVPGKPTFNIEMKYNSDAAATTAKARCYDAAAGDTIHMTVTSGAPGTMSYTYQLNSGASQNTPTFVITETEPGTYTDTIRISAVHTYPDLRVCNWDTTVYYTLTIDTLPTAPANFPHAYNGDSTIFYCQGSTATYNFTPKAGYTYTYSSGSKPTTAGSYNLIVTDNNTGCASTFPYKIVEVPKPTTTWIHTANSKNCGELTINDTIVASITNSINPSYTRFFVWNPGDSVAKTVNADTLYHTFSYLGDTMVTIKIGVHAENGEYSATCYKTPNDTVKVTFQPRPGMPELNPTYAYYVDSANAAYCSPDASFTLTASNFLPIPGATINIVGYTTITTAGVYKVVANHLVAPYCPSDTLTLYVKAKRTPLEPTNIGAGKYNYHVYFCDGSTPVYNFTAANANDEFLYSTNPATTFVTTQPDTAGSYTLRVRDIVDSCYIDVNFTITKVANPNFNITIDRYMPSPTFAYWVDTNMCQGSAYAGLFVSTETRVGTIAPGATADYTRTWTGDIHTIYSPYYNFTVTADSNIVYSYVGKDTIGNTGYGVACPFEYRDTITIHYFAMPDVPVYTGDTTFCAGDSIKIENSNFTLATGTELVSTPALPVTFKATGGNVVVYAQYPTLTSCKSTNNTIKITKYDLPSVAIAPHGTTICQGDTAILKVSGAVTYEWSTGAIIDSIFATDSIKYAVEGTDAHGCKNVDTVKINFHPTFTVEMSADTTVCVGGTATISAQAIGGSGDFNYKWYQDDATTPFANEDIVISVQSVNPPASPRVNGSYVPTHYSVLVTDNLYGCTSKAADNYVDVTAADGPYIIFRQIDSTESIRHMHVNQGDQSGFEMYIYDKGGCNADPNLKVFVDYQIYKNGVPMTNAELAEMMDEYVGSNNMLYDFDLSVGAGNISTLTVQSTSNTANGFFPDISNQEWMGGLTFYFDWFYMHFILGVENSDGGHDGRKITVNTGMWKPGSSGVYTFSYAVVRAGMGAATNNGLCYEGTKLLGGYGSHSGLTVKDTIVSDFFTIYVGDSVYSATSNYNDIAAPTDVTTYPTVSEDKYVDMKVYPNPASNNVNVVLEGISGQTNIMVYDMSGKVVSSMRVEVANNGQIINLPVENYTQGIYFIKAVNNDAVMTKKLIIAR